MAWGIAAALLYVITAVLVSRVMPVRILYEGEAPPVPYRWVAPPPALAGSNLPPETGAATVPVGQHPGQGITGDGRCGGAFPEGSIARGEGGPRAKERII